MARISIDKGNTFIAPKKAIDALAARAGYSKETAWTVICMAMNHDAMERLNSALNEECSDTEYLQKYLRRTRKNLTVLSKPYCTQNDGDCHNCSLVNYGYDCRNFKLSDKTTISQLTFSAFRPIVIDGVPYQPF